jgi:biotin carboxylase
VRPVVMLLIGTRGIRITDTVRQLRSVGDVVVVTSNDIMNGRADQLDDDLPAEVVMAPDRATLVDHAIACAGRRTVDGVLTFSDDLLEAAAVVADRLGLPGQPTETIALFRDKYLQRGALAAAGVPTPRFARLMSPADVPAVLAEVPLPAILKPTRGSGGALASIVTTPDELGSRVAQAFDDAARAGGAVDPDTAFILEELLMGDPAAATPGFAPYVSVESIAVGGAVCHLAITDRFPTAPPVLETGMMLPSALGASARADVFAMAGQALHALGFRTGLAHTELMLTADGPRVIEVNGRAGGALPYLFPMVTSVNLIARAGLAALGTESGELATFTGHAVFVSPHHPIGVEIEKVDGLDQIAALPAIRAVIPISVGPGRTDAHRDTLIAAILATVDTPGEAVEVWREVMALVRPQYAPADPSELLT